MSRIVLTTYDNDQEHVVVGWDHPAGGAFWQEFNKEPDDWDSPEAEGWEEVTRNGGMWPGITLDKLIDDMPDDLKPLMTDEVMSLLALHAGNPDSGRIRIVLANRERDMNDDIQAGIDAGNRAEDL